MEYSGFPTHSRCIGMASDHGGFELKEKLRQALKDEGYDLFDFGASQYEKDVDYPDVVALLARAIMREEVDRGIAICGSGVGVCITANKIPGVRAALLTYKHNLNLPTLWQIGAT
jgi:ribose 5-phosphate isomerase B